jgi:hypothetical protein
MFLRASTLSEKATAIFNLPEKDPTAIFKPGSKENPRSQAAMPPSKPEWLTMLTKGIAHIS